MLAFIAWFLVSAIAPASEQRRLHADEERALLARGRCPASPAARCGWCGCSSRR
jgi:hypothetical protein